MSENDIPSTTFPRINNFKEEGPHIGPYDRPNPKPLLPSIISRSPPGRSSTLPPIRHREKVPRPRKPSVTEGGRKAKHEKNPSRGHGRRVSYDGRKAFSAEPSSAANLFGNRWEDLIDAATTATKEADDPVPASTASPTLPAGNRLSLPPLPPSHFPPYQQPLHYSPTLPPPPPPPPLPPRSEPPHTPLLPSVENSGGGSGGGGGGGGGEQFHMESRGLDSSPTRPSTAVVNIVCASCRTSTALCSAYACTECICGICHSCVDILVGEQGRGKRCPTCGTLGGKFKPFQLELR
ncbi:MAG: hypothetical protein M1813_009828 [Trichoglossum hirsutum]|nr:MAG: hypothetical protein M1813_009828 [Trichoglossum hirsutum]